MIPEQKIKLNFINGAFEDNEEYRLFIKQMHLKGIKTIFSLYVEKLKHFA